MSGRIPRNGAKSALREVPVHPQTSISSDFQSFCTNQKTPLSLQSHFRLMPSHLAALKVSEEMLKHKKKEKKSHLKLIDEF
jgi:4-alpha-glucanotransferase